MRQRFVDPSALLLGQRSSVLVAPLGVHGSLQDLLNAYLAQRQARVGIGAACCVEHVLLLHGRSACSRLHAGGNSAGVEGSTHPGPAAYHCPVQAPPPECVVMHFAAELLRTMQHLHAGGWMGDAAWQWGCADAGAGTSVVRRRACCSRAVSCVAPKFQLLTPRCTPSPPPPPSARILHADIKPDNLLVRLDADADGESTHERSGGSWEDSCGLHVGAQWRQLA